MHVILFLICVYILVRRRARGKQRIMILMVAVVMFILATADIAVSWNVLLQDTTSLYTGNTTTLLERLYPKFLLYIVNKSVFFKLCNSILTYLFVFRYGQVLLLIYFS